MVVGGGFRSRQGVAVVVARGWLGWSSGGGFRGLQGGGWGGRRGVAFVVARGWLGWSSGGGFRGRLGLPDEGSRVLA